MNFKFYQNWWNLETKINGVKEELVHCLGFYLYKTIYDMINGETEFFIYSKYYQY